MLRRHFEREEKNRRAARNLRAVRCILRVETRGIERHVGRQRSFAGAGTSGENEKVRRLQSAKQRVDVGETAGHARDASPALLCTLGLLYRAFERLGEIERAVAVFRRF